MLAKDQTIKLRAWVCDRAEAYSDNRASYDDTCFTTDAAAAHIGAKALPVYNVLQDLETEGLVGWHRPASTPGYWMPTLKAARLRTTK